MTIRRLGTVAARIKARRLALRGRELRRYNSVGLTSRILQRPSAAALSIGNLTECVLDFLSEPAHQGFFSRLSVREQPTR